MKRIAPLWDRLRPRTLYSAATAAQQLRDEKVEAAALDASSAQPYTCSQVFAPTGQFHRVAGRPASLAARILRFGVTHLTMQVSGRQSVAVGQTVRGSFIIGSKGPIAIEMTIQSVTVCQDDALGGIVAQQVVGQMTSPSRRLRAALGQYALQFGQVRGNIPEPRALVKAGLGPVSLDEAVVIERPHPEDTTRLKEVAKLRCTAFRELKNYATHEMLDDWDTAPQSGQIVIARLRGRIVSSMRSAFPRGESGLLPLHEHLPHLIGKLPYGKMVEVGRKVGDTAFWYGDMFALLSAQTIRDGLIAGRDTVIACVLMDDMKRYLRLGFSDTNLRGIFPAAKPEPCGVIVINLHDLWTGRLGFVAWRMLVASAEADLPRDFVLEQTLLDRLRLFVFRRCNHLVPSYKPTHKKRKRLSNPVAPIHQLR